MITMMVLLGGLRSQFFLLLRALSFNILFNSWFQSLISLVLIFGYLLIGGLISRISTTTSGGLIIDIVGFSKGAQFMVLSCAVRFLLQ